MKFIPYEEIIIVERIKGIIFGSMTITFRQYFNLKITDKELQKTKYDQWRYVSILTDERSYDYIFKNKQDSIDFIIAVNSSILR